MKPAEEQRTAERVPPSGLPGGDSPGEDFPLVSSPISQQREPLGFEKGIFLAGVKRPFHGPLPTPPDRTDDQIQSFSSKSRGRLRTYASESREFLCSQFCCTYHNYWPINGRVFKQHLNAFLTAARRAFPSLRYLWVAEFQTRGAPHAHVFLELPATDANRFKLAVIWCRIVDLTDRQLLAFHSHTSNMCAWTMGSGSYLCKYLDKQHQKAIPEGFHSFGRWWGNSRGLVPPRKMTTVEEIYERFPQVNEKTGEISDIDPVKFLVRTLGRYHEKINRRSWFRRTNRSSTILTGAAIYEQTLCYLQKLHDAPLPERRKVIP